MEPGGNRKWYTKKRYIIPAGIVAFFIFIAAVSDPSPANQPLSGTPPTTIEIKETSEVDQVEGTDDSLPSPSREVETTEPKTTTPAPASIPTPTPTPVPTPVAPKPTNNCDPNYSGCVPIASDVDCASGNGDGPAYVNGPIYVTGFDKYQLDRDKDGIACDK